MIRYNQKCWIIWKTNEKDDSMYQLSVYNSVNYSRSEMRHKNKNISQTKPGFNPSMMEHLNPSP
jgi:hypothetical protein